MQVRDNTEFNVAALSAKAGAKYRERTQQVGALDCEPNIQQNIATA
jgi:hypothetical protein